MSSSWLAAWRPYTRADIEFLTPNVITVLSDNDDRAICHTLRVMKGAGPAQSNNWELYDHMMLCGICKRTLVRFDQPFVERARSIYAAAQQDRQHTGYYMEALELSDDHADDEWSDTDSAVDPAESLLSAVDHKDVRGKTLDALVKRRIDGDAAEADVSTIADSTYAYSSNEVDAEDLSDITSYYSEDDSEFPTLDIEHIDDETGYSDDYTDYDSYNSSEYDSDDEYDGVGILPYCLILADIYKQKIKTRADHAAVAKHTDGQAVDHKEKTTMARDVATPQPNKGYFTTSIGLCCGVIVLLSLLLAS